MDSELFMRISAMDNEGLEGPFSKDEVAKALSELGGDKALGLDGFSMALWKFFWPIVGGK